MVFLHRITRAWKRWRIRRLYNSSEWVKASILAEEHIFCKTNDLFARDIVIRCMYNQQNWNGVLEFAKRFPLEQNKILADRARGKIGDDGEALPERFSLIEWDDVNLLENWYQYGDTVWWRHPWGWTHWIMPAGFQLSNIHPSLLALATKVLIKPWVPESTKIVTERRGFGTKLALSFSGGMDSMAAALLLPTDTILSYHERSFPSLLSHDLPIRLFDEIKQRWGRDVLQVPSNHEKIRIIHGKQVGFSTDYAAGVHLILLADYLNLEGIAFGTPIDNIWLQKGRKFRDFKESWHWNYWVKEFANAGLHLVMPINHISEAGAMKIFQQSDLIESINSCLRGRAGKFCGKCWKCFHKNGPLGRKIDPMSNEIQILLHKIPLRTAQHALWAIQRMGLEYVVPHLSKELIQPLDWWEKAYAPGLDLIQRPWRTTIQENTEKFIPYMENPELLHEVNLFSDYPL